MGCFILNLTEEPATKKQLESGIYDPRMEDKFQIQHLLISYSEEGDSELNYKAMRLAMIAKSIYAASHVLIGGESRFMNILEDVLKKNNIVSVRVKQDKAQYKNGCP
jgi:hypothetical protein